MKILMITPYLPYPLYSGGQIRTFNLLKHLSEKHKITLVSFIRKNEEKTYLPLLSKFTEKIITIKRRRAWNLINILLAGFSNYPFLVSIYYSPHLKRIIKKLLEEDKYDLIHAETFYVLPNIPPTTTPILLVEQTIEYLVYQRYSQRTPFFFLKPFLFIDVAKIIKWEKYYWKTVTKLATVSDKDKEYIQKNIQRKDIQVVPNGVDFDSFKSVYEENIKRKKGKNVLFVGNFTWLPNREGVHILAKEIWPIIHKRFPSAKLLIVGRNPTYEIIRLNNPQLGIEVLGEINDIRQAFSLADLSLLPIKNGRGTKYKVLESIAAGVPVVGTPLAVEGLNLTPGKEVLVGQTSQELTDYACQLLQNPQLGKEISQAALLKLKKQFSWTKVAKQLENIYFSVSKRKK